MVAEQRRGDTGDLTRAVAAARDGDDDAFRTVYRAVHPPLLRYVRSLVGDDADDVASESWLQIARGISGFDGDGDGFRGWAATIARHRAMDHLRRQRRRQTVAVPDGEFADLPAGEQTEALAVEGISTESALAMIATLPPDQAEAVMLRVVMGLDATSAAAVLGKRSGAVRTAAYRGLRRLAALVEPSAPDEPRPPHQGRR